MVEELNEKNFKQEVLDYEGAMLVEFWASWCPPCKRMEPVLEQLEKDTGIKIGRMNINMNRITPRKYNVGGVPTFVMFKNGKELERHVGARSQLDLKELIEKFK